MMPIFPFYYFIAGNLQVPFLHFSPLTFQINSLDSMNSTEFQKEKLGCCLSISLYILFHFFFTFTWKYHRYLDVFLQDKYLKYLFNVLFASNVKYNFKLWHQNIKHFSPFVLAMHTANTMIILFVLQRLLLANFVIVKTLSLAFVGIAPFIISKWPSLSDGLLYL